jgi:hypothetical protein
LGHKSRGGWNINLCLRYDCINQGDKEMCDKCFKNSNYERFKRLDAIAGEDCQIQTER